MAGLLIGGVAERTGLTAPTIRYYESIGLLPVPVRSATGYRRYPEAVVEELRFVKKAQTLGFSLEEIREILALSRAGDTPCSHVLDLSRRHLQAVEDRIAQLTRFRDQLAGELAKWDGEVERVDLPNGYRVRFEPAADILPAIAKMVDVERQCCRFLTFALTIEPDGGPIWLEFTGRPGAQEFLAGMLDL